MGPDFVKRIYHRGELGVATGPAIEHYGYYLDRTAVKGGHFQFSLPWLERQQNQLFSGDLEPLQ